MLLETTDWDRRNYEYFTAGGSTYSIGDRIVVFDLAEGNLSVVEIKESTRTPRRTPDGYHFFAYKRMRGIPRRRLVKNRWESLKATALIRSKNDARSDRKMSASQFEAFVENLRTTAR